MSNMWRFFARASGVAGVARSSHQQHTSTLIGSSLLVGGGLLYAHHQSSLSMESPSPQPLSSVYFDFKVLAEQTENPSSTPAEEAISEAAKHIAAGEASIRNAAAAAHKKEQEDKAKKVTADHIATGEASIRAAATGSHKKEQEDKAKKVTADHIATGEASIRDAAVSSHKSEQEAATKAAAIATAEGAIRKEAQDAYERENDPRTAPPPQVVLERNEEEFKRQAVGAGQGGVDEFEVYKKWKTYLDELAEEQEVQIKEQYDAKVKEMEEFVNKKLYQKVFKEKELLEEKFKEKYRVAIQNLKIKFQEEKKRLYEQSVESQMDSEHEYMSKLSQAKHEYLQDLERLRQETDKTFAKIERQVSLQHASRVEDQKELMKKYREHTEYQKELTNQYEEGKSKVAVSLAALALIRAAETGGQDYNAPLDEMAACAKEDPFLSELVKVIPRGEEGHGVPSLTQLQVHFGKIVDQAFHDTLMGNDGSYWAYAKSRVVGNTLIRKRGLVNGGAMEDSLARAEFYLGEGDLGKCLEELQKIEGPAQVTLACWVHEAKRRQETLLALQAIEAYVRVFLKAPSSSS